MKKHIDTKHIEIQQKHNTAMHKELGEMYGYPKCCIKQFCDEQKVGIMPWEHRQQTFKRFLPNLGYVPCDSCTIKILQEIDSK